MICPKLKGNCAFSQNFRTRKLAEIMAFFVVHEAAIDINDTSKTILFDI